MASTGNHSTLLFSPNDEFLISTTDDGNWETPEKLQIWDVTTGKQIKYFDVPGVATQAMFSPDGLWLLAATHATAFPPLYHSRLWLWNMQDALSGKSEDAYTPLYDGDEEKLDIDSAVFTSDGKYIVAHSNNLFLWWATDTGERQSNVPIDSNELPLGSAIGTTHPSQFALFGKQGDLILWNIERNVEVGRFEHSTREYDDVEKVAISPDGLYAVTLSASTIKRWSINQQELEETQVFDFVYTSEQGLTKIYKVAFSPDSLLIAKGGRDGKVRIWDIASGQQFAIFEIGAEDVDLVTFSSDGILLSAATPNQVMIWEVSTAKLITSLSVQYPIHKLEFRPQYQQLVFLDYQGLITFWNYREQTTDQRNYSDAGRVFDFTYDPTGQLFAVISNATSQAIELWDTRVNKLIASMQVDSPYVWFLAFNDQSNVLIAGTSEGVHAWDILTQQPISLFEHQDTQIKSSWLSQNSDLTLTYDVAYGNTHLRETESSRILPYLRVNNAPLGGVGAFSPNGKILALSQVGSFIYLWGIPRLI